MTSPTRVSVVMATYNGATFVGEQLDSVLAQLGDRDEVVVVDDASTDDTARIVAGYDDPRVRLLRSPVNRGYVRTFETALRSGRGELLLLADQDDVWVPGRLERMVRALADHDVVAGNLGTLGEPHRLPGPFDIHDWTLDARDGPRHVRNVLGILAGLRPYYGCAMGIRRQALDVVLPFPDYLSESHDLWLALYGNLAGSMAHVDDRTVLRRLHEGNQTPVRPRGPLTVLVSRARLVRAVTDLQRRIRRSAG